MIVRALFVLAAAFSVDAQIPPVQEKPLELATLRYIDLRPGNGAAATAGKRFTVHYTGWLKDGTKFDSSVDRNAPFRFVQGRRQVIAGWDIGFDGMKVGGKRRLLIPYQLAYGEKGTEGIPGEAELIFDVELLDVADAPVVAPAVDVLIPFAELESKVVALAREIPDAKFDAIFASVFSHIVNLNRAMLAGAMKDEPAISEMAADEDIKGRSELIEALSSSFAAVKKELEAARNGYLGSDADLFGKIDTRRGLFTALDASVAEALGQAIEHARTMGISGHGIFAPQ